MSSTKQVTDSGFPGVAFASIMLVLGGLCTWAAAQPCKCPQNSHSDKVAIVLFPVVFGAFAMFFLSLQNAWRITWDDAGLRYGVFGLKQVPWSAVVDYGICATKTVSRRGKFEFVLRLDTGKELESWSSWNNHEAFQKAVQEKATGARVREWSEIGLRSIDTAPEVFTYDARTAKRWMVLIPIITTLPMIPFIAMLVRKTLQGFSPVGWQWEVALYAILLIVILAYSGGLGGMTVYILRDTVWRGHESFTVLPETIQFTSGGETQIRSWEEVSDYYTERLPRVPHRVYTVRFGENGTVFRFTANITRAEQLMRLIEKRTRLNDQPWRGITKTNAASIPLADWKKGDSGTQVYYHRPRQLRTLIISMTIMLLCLPLAPVLDIAVNQTPTQHYAAILPIGIISIFIMVIYWWYYLTHRVETDDQGITRYMFAGKKHLDWSEVRNWKTEGSYLILQGAENKKIFISLDTSDGEILPYEIEQRTGLTPFTGT